MEVGPYVMILITEFKTDVMDVVTALPIPLSPSPIQGRATPR